MKNNNLPTQSTKVTSYNRIGNKEEAYSLSYSERIVEKEKQKEQIEHSAAFSRAGSFLLTSLEIIFLLFLYFFDVLTLPITAIAIGFLTFGHLIWINSCNVAVERELKEIERRFKITKKGKRK